MNTAALSNHTPIAATLGVGLPSAVAGAGGGGGVSQQGMAPLSAPLREGGGSDGGDPGPLLQPTAPTRTVPLHHPSPAVGLPPGIAIFPPQASMAPAPGPPPSGTPVPPPSRAVSSTPSLFSGGGTKKKLGISPGLQALVGGSGGAAPAVTAQGSAVTGNSKPLEPTVHHRTPPLVVTQGSLFSPSNATTSQPEESATPRLIGAPVSNTALQQQQQQPASGPETSALGHQQPSVGDKRQRGQLDLDSQRPLVAQVAPALRTKQDGKGAAATPNQALIDSAAATTATAAQPPSDASFSFRSTSPFSPTEILSAILLRTPATASALPAASAQGGSTPLAHHHLSLTPGPTPAPVQQAFAPTVNALLLDLPTRPWLPPPAMAAGVAAGCNGGGRLRRRSSTGSLDGGSAPSSRRPSFDGSSGAAVAGVGSVIGGGVISSLAGISGALMAASGIGGVVAAGEPREQPRHLEAACREVRMLAGPPANSKLHSIVMNYLKHQHRQVSENE